VLQTVMPVYNCASDPHAGKLLRPHFHMSSNGTFPSPDVQYARSSYKGVSGECGTNSVPWDTSWNGLEASNEAANPLSKKGILTWCGANGGIGRGKPTKIGDIIDGTSNTAMVAEYGPSGQINAAAQAAGFSYDEGRGPFWAYSYNGSSYVLGCASGFGHTLNNAYGNCRVLVASSNQCKKQNWGSNHGGGVINTLMGDGAVRAISPNIDAPKIWTGLATINNGEVLGEF
jgi:hypothetical protein